MPPVSSGSTSLSSTASATPKRMRRKQLFAIWMCQFVEGVHTTLPYALAVFLVRSMLSNKEGGDQNQPPPSESVVGWTTGALAACWSFAQFCTSMLWGRISDAGLGRKPLLAMSAVSSGVSVLFFGTSRTLFAAAAARLVGGAFNCTFVALKCVIAEGSPAGKQSGPMSILALAWGCGTIVGPALGALASPCGIGNDESGSSWVSSSSLCEASSSSSSSSTSSSAGLFVRYPFLFPCVAASLLSAAAVVNATLVLEETLPSLVEKRKEAEEERRRRQELSSSLSSSSSFRLLVPRRESLRRVLTFSSPYALVGASALRSSGGGGEAGEGDEGSEMERGGVELSSSTTTTKAMTTRKEKRSSLLSSSTTSSPPTTTNREQPRAPASAFASSSLSSSQQPSTTSTMPSADAPSPPPPPPPPSSIPWHKLPQVRLTLCGYGSVAFLFNLLDELVPIFASAAERDGGLGWSPSQLAPPLAVGGVALILWSQLGYFRLQRRVGTLRAARCGLAGMAPFCVLLAAPTLVPRGLPRATALSLLLVLRSCFANNAFTSSMVLVNEAAPKEQIGLVNGCGQTLASLVRAVGPALGGGLWGISSTGLGPPFGSFLPFALVSVGLVASSMIYTRVSPPPGEAGGGIVEEYQLIGSSSSSSTAEAATTELSGSVSGKAKLSSSPLQQQGEDGSGKGLLLFDEDGRIDDGSSAAAETATEADASVKVVVVPPE